MRRCLPIGTLLIPPGQLIVIHLLEAELAPKSVYHGSANNDHTNSGAEAENNDQCLVVVVLVVISVFEVTVV